MKYDLFDFMSIQNKEKKVQKSLSPVLRKYKPYYMFQLKTQKKHKSAIVPIHSKFYYKKLMPQLLKLNLFKKWKNSFYESSKIVLRKNKSESILNSSRYLNTGTEKYTSIHSSNENSNIPSIEIVPELYQKKSRKNPRNVKKSDSSMYIRKNLFSSLKKKSLKKFHFEFFSVCDSIDLTCSGHLNYSKFCKVLSSLHFINDSFNKSKEETEQVLKAWRLLGGLEDGKVKIDSLYFFLIRILDKKAEVNEKNKERSKVYQRIKKVNVHDEFLPFFVNRTQKDKSLARLDRSNISVPEVVIEQVQDRYSKIFEQDEVALTENVQCSLLYLPKKIIKLNFRNQSETPNLLEKVQNSSFCETPGNRSFHESEIEQGSPNSEFGSEKSIGSLFWKINTRKNGNEGFGRHFSYRVKGEELQSPCINRSLSCRTQGEKNGLQESSTMTDSKMVISTVTYASLLSGQRAVRRVEIINESD